MSRNMTRSAAPAVTASIIPGARVAGSPEAKGLKCRSMASRGKPTACPTASSSGVGVISNEDIPSSSRRSAKYALIPSTMLRNVPEPL